MGFPVGYSDLLLPKLVLHLLVLLGAVRRCLLWVFRTVGLGDLLEMDEPSVQGHATSRILQHRRPQFKSVPSVLIEEALPVVKFEELDSNKAEAVCCAVCLYDIEGREEVRRLSNCCHVFHRGCLDRWMEHDQHTCPLCRAKLIPDEMGSPVVCSNTSDTASTMVSADTTEFSDYDYFLPSLPSSPLPSPILFQAHQLLGPGY
ncbi:RING/U-box superfamily protein [Rhynchospora pubera]|uniref:RING/U-box superfamily protein n=1 Tax=Rhynchospora pubera TaxID=906938 RepID=A0AAV8G7T6_9POAL|nr:RING/U-box superfamily protein [Rhynchospora pubera]